MDYAGTIEYLYAKLPLFSRIGAAAYKADLSNTIALCKALGDPQTKFKSIHIAGTNGKGSVAHMMASVLQTAGFRTGLYTSPHLKDFRERIRVNGEMINSDFIVEFTEKVKPLIEKISPSFFEITVAMAFSWFEKEKVDVAVIETGMGGRLDSTNVIVPELSVITNIGMDHMDLLGNTLEKIAYEKAGIIKPGIPVVVGEVLPQTRSLFEEVARGKGSPLSIAADKRKALNWYWMKQNLVVEVESDHQTDHKIYQLDLPGIYQVRNLITTLEACSMLNQQGWNLDDHVIHEGLRYAKKNTGLHGRWEIIRHSPLVALDVAHNPEGIRLLLQQIEVTDHRELHIIFGMVRDKDSDAVISLLPGSATYYFTQAQIPRALPYLELKEKANALGLEGTAWPDVNSALDAALSHADPADLIVVCGSVFLVGEILP